MVWLKRTKFETFVLAILLAILSPRMSVAASNAVTGIKYDVTVKGQVTVSGTYTTAPGVTLTEIRVFANPSFGGRVAFGSSKSFNNGNWENCIVAGLYGQQYTFLIQAIYSDKSVYGVCSSSNVLGDGPPPSPKLEWNPGSPSSSKSLKIDAGAGKASSDNTGTVTWAAKQQGIIMACHGSGCLFPKGNLPNGILTFSPSPKTWKSAIIEGFTSGSSYILIAHAIASDGNTYCAPITNVVVKGNK